MSCARAGATIDFVRMVERGCREMAAGAFGFRKREWDMSEEGKTKEVVEGTPAEMTEREQKLANALQFERAKNQVLLNEVVALEDEVVNRHLTEFESVVSEGTREFWRTQLLENREAATKALQEMATRAKPGESGQAAGGEGKRPLHNRAVARPAVRTASGEPVQDGKEGVAAKIRNRAQEIARTERVAFSVAFRRAEGEIAG